MSTNKVIVITGSSDGIGAAAARQLHERGHRVVIVGRSPEKTAAVARNLGVDSLVADFTRLEDVRTLASHLQDAYPRIDVLANNAGGVFGDPTKTIDGFEKTFQINHLAPFLLTNLLIETLIESKASVIQTSSVGAKLAKALNIDDLNHDHNFDATRAYTAAKLENILFTKELHRRSHARGISTAAFHPGNIATSFATQSEAGLMRFVATNRVARAVMLSTPDKGADQLVWLADKNPGTDWQSGAYYEKRKPKRTNPQALDVRLATELWDRSEDMTASLSQP
ncbi:short-chain dehydrogenase [Frondihabitans sucicola]|uniref:Short-chain dehydrogenase n=1 Tax=Frondihabitans sucicola TaxID=1268041 RepID=A0ABM8GK72_9MICO|nr:SDR family NAD(P)-dependent oxidoreductase [Frondihabitans sucicola]BDZ48587.1 short-chain dehydrogenase [Frondihabitans sucicola]